jgi:hypothetical protein
MNDMSETLAEYREAAEGTGDAVAKRANRWHARMNMCYRALRQSESGRKGITSLVSDDNPHVRVWAAAHALQWAPELARLALESLRDSQGPCSLTAEMTLNEFDKGRLSFDY